MNHRLIRRLDAGVGRLVCLLLTLHRRFIATRHAVPPPLRRVLFLKLTDPGSAVLAMPAFARAVDLVGPEQIYLCTFAENRQILDVLAPCPAANVWTLRGSNLWYFFLDLVVVVRRARKLGIDAVVDMEQFARASAVIAYLTGAQRRVGLHRFTMEGPYRGDLLTHKVLYNPTMHATTNYLTLVYCLPQMPSSQPINKLPEPDFPSTKYKFQPTDADVAGLKQLLQGRCDSPLPNGPRILLNPNGSDQWPLRKWPTPSFIELARQLLAAYPDALVIFTGQESERHETELLCAAMPSPRLMTVAGSTSLRQLLTLFSLSDVLITSDSGSGLYASLTDISNIILFGPESSDYHAPVNPNTRPMSARLTCSPCISALNHRRSPCTNNRCMQGISVASVLSETRQSLARQTPRPALGA